MLGRSAILLTLALLGVGAANATDLPASAKTSLTVPMKTPRGGGVESSNSSGLESARQMTVGGFALSAAGQAAKK
jgi:hypothetical protein